MREAEVPTDLVRLCERERLRSLDAVRVEQALDGVDLGRLVVTGDGTKRASEKTRVTHIHAGSRKRHLREGLCVLVRLRVKGLERVV